jgi:hypothetical protein
MYNRYKDRAEFVFVAIHEARHRVSGFEFLIETPSLPPQQAEAHRRQCLDRAMKLAKLPMKGFFDLPNDSACEAYAAFPGRLLILNKAGRIVRDFGRPTQSAWNWKEFARIMEEKIGGKSNLSLHSNLAPGHAIAAKPI